MYEQKFSQLSKANNFVNVCMSLPLEALHWTLHIDKMVPNRDSSLFHDLCASRNKKKNLKYFKHFL